MKSLLYIHGFLSSPLSAKAVATGDYIRARDLPISCLVPQLASYPAAALVQLESQLQPLLKQGDPVGLVGSSLGGFFATVLAERHQLPAVLINPAVRPWRAIHDALGENLNPYTGERFVITDCHLEELRNMGAGQLQQPERYWVLLQEGDEVLDYRDAVDYYRDCRLTVEPDGSHHFDGYERYLPDILKFLQLQANDQ